MPLRKTKAPRTPRPKASLKKEPRKKPSAARAAQAKEMPTAGEDPELSEEELLPGLKYTQRPTHPNWTHRGVGLHGSTAPQWARLGVRRLREAGLLGGEKQPLTLQLWLDCGGIASAKIASSALSLALREECDINVNWKVYCYCDKDHVAARFVQQNFDPTHVSDNMEHRNFETNTFWCTKCNASHELPREGIDIYIAGFPCNPWSRRGTRKGWDHPDIVPFKIGFRTIERVRPALWIYEVPEGVNDHVGGAAETGLQQILSHIRHQLGNTDYTVHVSRDVDPTWFGFPERRPRVFTLGWRADVGPPEEVHLGMHELLRTPLITPPDFRAMLQLQHTPDWSKVGDYPAKDDLDKLKVEGLQDCNCREDPLKFCPIHMCCCKKCGDDGVSCAWRHHMVEFLEKNPTLCMHEPGATQKLTYTQVMALNGLPIPTSPRVLNLLNVIARMPELQPLEQTLGVIDTSQTVTMGSLRRDGAIPTLTTSSHIFCLQQGGYLSTGHLSSLMGFDVADYDLQGCTEAWWRKRLGLCMHPASIGSMMLVLISAPLSGRGA